jgi:hypothetical protein
MKQCKTRGDVVVNNLKVDDIIYEFEYNLVIVAKVTTTPLRSPDGYWTFDAVNTLNSRVINYAMDENLSHYAPKLYTYMAYSECTQI